METDVYQQHTSGYSTRKQMQTDIYMQSQRRESNPDLTMTGTFV